MSIDLVNMNNQPYLRGGAHEAIQEASDEPSDILS